MCKQACVVTIKDAVFLDAATLKNPELTDAELVLALVAHHREAQAGQACDGMCLTAHARLVVQLWRARQQNPVSAWIGARLQAVAERAVGPVDKAAWQ